MDPNAAQQLEVLELLERLEVQVDEQKQEIQSLRGQLTEKDTRIEELEKKVVNFEKLAQKRLSISTPNRPLPGAAVPAGGLRTEITPPTRNGNAEPPGPSSSGNEEGKEGIDSGVSQGEAKNALAALLGARGKPKPRSPPPQANGNATSSPPPLSASATENKEREENGDAANAQFAGIPDLERWNKMKKMGIPPSHIRNKMVQEGVPAPLIGMFLGESATDVMRPKTVIDFGALGLREKRVIHTTVKMKRLHWEVIHPKRVQNTIWKDIDDTKIQVEDRFQLQFQMRQPKPKTTHAQATPRSANTNEPHHFVSKKRSQQVQIGLRGMQLQPEQIRDAIVRMDEEVLHQDSLMQLMDFAPTEEEQRQAEREAEQVTSARFGDCEKFFYSLYDLVELQMRLKLWLFKMQFRDIVLNLNDQMRDVKKASDVLRNSRKFKSLLAVILALGNTMNAGTRKGQAYGFQMTALSLLPNIKTINNQMSLLMYVYQFCRQYNPQALECINELQVLRSVSSLESDVLQRTIERLFSEMDELTEAIDRWKRDYEDILDPHDRFIPVMEAFHTRASKEMNKLKMRTGLFNTSIKKLKKTFDWGSEDHDLPVEQLFRLIRDFMDGLSRAEQDLINLEKERQKRKAKKEKMKKMKNRRNVASPRMTPRTAARAKAESDAEPNILDEIKLASQVKQAKFAALSRSISGHVRQRSRLITAKFNGDELPADIANNARLQQVSEMVDRSWEQVEQYESVRRDTATLANNMMAKRRSGTANRVFDLDAVAQRRPPTRATPIPENGASRSAQHQRQPNQTPSPQRTFFPANAGSPPTRQPPTRATPTNMPAESPRSPPSRALPPNRPLPGQGQAQQPTGAPQRQHRPARIIRRNG